MGRSLGDTGPVKEAVMPAGLIVLLVVAVVLLVVGLKSIMLWAPACLAIVLVWYLCSTYKESNLNQGNTLARLIRPKLYGATLHWEKDDSAINNYVQNIGTAFLAFVAGISCLALLDTIVVTQYTDPVEQWTTRIAGWGITIAVGVISVKRLNGWSKRVIHAAIERRIKAAQTKLERVTEIETLENEISIVAKNMGFVFPLQFSDGLRQFIAAHKDGLIRNPSTLDAKVQDSLNEAREVLRRLKIAQGELSNALSIYDETLRIVYRSGSIALIRTMEQLHDYLRATVLSEFLTKRRWEDFSQCMREGIEEIRNLAKLADDYHEDSASQRKEAYDSKEHATARQMTRKEALNVLDLSDDANDEQIKLAWKAMVKKWNVDARQQYEPHVLRLIEEQLKLINIARDILLPRG